ncbi:MAG: 4-(cytidine 5'-diphospho)-2-C-methyl-D-erythritol kinase [Pseudomonadota bacterium]
MTATIFAPIKINIALHVGPLKADGYHPVDTLCVFPAIGDILTYEEEGEPGIDFAGPFAGPLLGEDIKTNLIWKAFAILGAEPTGRFFLTKTTPVASGVGAGTADGAAAMLLLNDVLGLGFDADQLIARSLGLGADGPICMAAQIGRGGLWRARGIGERLTFEGPIEPGAVVVANPGVPVPTGQVFGAFDAGAPEELTAARRQKGEALSRTLAATRNDLESPAMALCPAIAALKDEMATHPGATAARMSGSGATCYTLHTSIASAQRSARSLKRQGYWAEASLLLAG